MRITGGEPLAPSRPRAPDRAARAARRRPDADDERVAARREGPALADAGLQRITVSLDALDDATFRALNDVDFPVERVLEGIDAARAAGLPVKVNAVIKRGVNDDQIVPMAGILPRARTHASLHRVHGRRAHERLAARRRRSGRRDRGHARRGVRRSSRSSRATAARSRPALALPRRQRRGRRDRLGHAAVLRRLHARAALGRGQGSTPACSRFAATTCARSCAAARPTRSSTPPSAASGRRRSDRYSELRSAATDDLPKVEMSYIGG